MNEKWLMKWWILNISSEELIKSLTFLYLLDRKFIVFLDIIYSEIYQLIGMVSYRH